MKNVEVVFCAIHPLRIIIDILTALNMETLVVEVEVCLVLLVVIMDTALISLAVDVIFITVHLVVVMMALQMIHVEQVQKAPHPLNQKDDEAKTDKKNRQYKINSNKAQ